MSERASRIAAFLRDAGWGHATRRPISGDASFRRYERLADGGRRAILMDAPPEVENVGAFRAVAELLAGMGLRPPAIKAADEAAGLLLLEDFGDRSFARVLADGGDAQALYALATDTLIALHARWSPDRAAAAVLPIYDDALLVEHEAMLLVDWYLPAVGLAPEAATRARYAAAWKDALRWAHVQPSTLVLRDFFPDNLMLLDGQDGPAACGLLDFQDAVIGCCAYDLASLLQDARRDVPAAIEQAMLARYLGAFPALDPEAFRAAYTVMAAQRHAKVIGIFTRLAHRDAKPGYLQHIPRLWRLLEAALAHPALGPVAAWLDSAVPTEARTVPEGETTA